MTADPFQTPQAPVGGPQAPGEYGAIDIGRAYATGWELTKRSFLPWLGVSLIVGLLIVLSSALFLIPVLVVGPAMMWGFMHYHLEVYEGRGEVRDAFSGFQEIGPALSGFLLFILCSVLISLPAQAISLIGIQMESAILQLVSTLLSLVVTLVTLRWAFAPLFIVEHRMNGLDAIRASWRATQGQWLTVFLFYLAAGAILILGTICLLVGIFPASAVVYFAFVAVYRQMVGPRKAAA